MRCNKEVCACNKHKNHVSDRDNSYLEGRNNPNVKYLTLNDNFFKNIDTEAKAYLLGFIASDASISENSIKLYLNQNDLQIIFTLKNIICEDLELYTKDNLIGFNISSKEIVKDVCKLLNILPGKKSDTVDLPKLNSSELTWAFIRGYFDGDGCVTKPGNTRYPKCDITSNSKLMRDSIVNFINIKCSNSDESNRIYFSNNNALDFLSKIYDNANYYLSRKKDLYIDWSLWVSSLSGKSNYGSNELIFRWNKSRKDAIPPSKTRASDSGYDLVLLEKIKSIGKIDFFDTGIKVQPEYGWYFDLVPRSSITKSGYMLANSIGVIDRTYIGNILVPLIKIDNDAPELELPNKLVQLIPRPIVHVNFLEVEELDSTQRGDGGFGSTGVTN